MLKYIRSNGDNVYNGSIYLDNPELNESKNNDYIGLLKDKYQKDLMNPNNWSIYIDNELYKYWYNKTLGLFIYFEDLKNKKFKEPLLRQTNDVLDQLKVILDNKYIEYMSTIERKDKLQYILSDYLERIKELDYTNYLDIKEKIILLIQSTY